MKIYMATIKMQVPSGQHAQSTKQTHITPYWPLSRLASCQQILTVTGAKCMARCCSWCQPGKLLIGCHPFWLQWEGTLHPLFNLSRNRCRNGDFLSDFLRPLFSARHVQYISDLHSKFEGHHVWKYGRHPTCDRWDLARKKEEERKKDRNHRAKL